MAEHKWHGRTVRIIEPLSKATISGPPFNVPYLEFTDSQWEKIRVNKDDEQPEIVDLRDTATGEVFRKVSASELNDTELESASDDEDADANEFKVGNDIICPDGETREIIRVGLNAAGKDVAFFEKSDSVTFEELEQVREDAEDYYATSSDDEDDDPLMEDVAEYLNPQGTVTTGIITDKRPRTDDVEPAVRLEFPYEYQINGAWIGSEKVHRHDDTEVVDFNALHDTDAESEAISSDSDVGSDDEGKD